jgi:DNA mismatch repair protein MLH1
MLIAKQILTNQLVSKREMLLEYFSITIDQQGNLWTLPVLLRDYRPNLDKLPQFLMGVAKEVNQRGWIIYRRETPMLMERLG